MARVGLLLVAAAATVLAFTLVSGRGGGGRGGSRSSPGTAAEAAGDRPVRYVCPMHPQVTSRVPGECPICRMALERVAPGPEGHAPGSGPAFSFAPLANPDDYRIVGAVGHQPFPLEVRAPAWLESPNRLTAVLYKDELEGLPAGARGLFVRASSPRAEIAVTLLAEPAVDWDESTSRVHLRVEGGGPKLEPGEVGWVMLKARTHDVLVVPWTALVHSPDGSHVLVASPDGRTFSKRHVDVGRVLGGMAVVLSGLRQGESIAVGSAFSLDAERRLQARSEQGGLPW